MKKIALILLSLILVFTFAACGTYTPPVTVDPPVTDGDGDGETDGGEEAPFTVTLALEGMVYKPLIEMSAQWTDGVTLKTAKFNSDGKASVTGLDGSYFVTLTNLPDGFTYNPNIYTATNDERDIVIDLYRIIKTTGTGTDKYNDIISLKSLGAYRLTFTEAGQQIFCQYEPTEKGVYVIESIMDINANEVNPAIDVYIGTSTWKPEKPNNSIDGGGASSVYTKNFRYEVEVFNRGNVYAFAVKFSSRVGVPVDIDFIITRNGDFELPVTSYEAVIPTEDFVQQPDFSFKDYYLEKITNQVGSRYVFDGSLVGYSDPRFGGDGYYHMLTEDGEIDEESLVYICLTGNMFVSFQEPLVNLCFSGKNYYYMIRGYSFLTEDGDNGYVGSVGGENNIPSGVMQKIEALDRKTYLDYANSDNCYPVTQELKQFLQEFSKANQYFLDGNGWCEGQGYDSSDEDQWLFGCFYYKKTISLS